MKTKLYLVVSLLAIALSAMACSRGGDDTAAVAGGGAVGVSSDGNTVTLNGTVEGKTLNVQVSEFIRSGSAYYANIAIKLAVNGIVRSGTLPTWETWGTIENFRFSAFSSCYDNQCNNALVILTFTPNDQNAAYDPASEYKRIAIKYDSVNKKVVNVKEYLARQNSLPSTQAMMSEL